MRARACARVKRRAGTSGTETRPRHPSTSEGEEALPAVAHLTWRRETQCPHAPALVECPLPARIAVHDRAVLALVLVAPSVRAKVVDDLEPLDSLALGRLPLTRCVNSSEAVLSLACVGREKRAARISPREFPFGQIGGPRFTRRSGTHGRRDELKRGQPRRSLMVPLARLENVCARLCRPPTSRYRTFLEALWFGRRSDGNREGKRTERSASWQI